MSDEKIYREYVVGAIHEQVSGLVSKTIADKNCDEIARKSGVALNRISRIANGEVTATINELALIGAACGYKLAIFFEKRND